MGLFRFIRPEKQHFSTLPTAKDYVNVYLYIHLLFTRNGSIKKEIQKKKNKKYTIIKSDSTKNQYAL